jgi:arginyl-tRNA synthetase
MTTTAARFIADNPALTGLERLVRDVEAPEGVDLANAAVDVNPRLTPAEFRIDVRPIADPAVSIKEACRRLADVLDKAPGIERAIVVPPNVYLLPSTELLAELVCAAALDDPDSYGRTPAPEPLYYIVSFSGPNVNKPLHLGHLRSNFLGMAVTSLLADPGHTVERQAPHCDWGIHIAQALLAWRKWTKPQTPEQTGEKGDHFVGRHYVMFHSKATPILEAEARALMQAMEDGDEELRAENRMMTGWADEGIRQTYARIGTRMDAVFYDQDYLAEGQRLIERGLAEGRCIRREDSSVYIDLTAKDLGEVTIVRKDGTPTVYRQWMAINIARYPSRPVDQIKVITGKEWIQGIQQLREVLRAMGEEWAAHMEGVHYGLVVLPEGRMKSRQGSGVSADLLLNALRDRLLQPWADGPSDAKAICETLGLGLLKYLFLTFKRSRDVTYSKDLLWGDGLPRFASVVRTLRWAEDPHSFEGRLGPDERALVLAVNRLPNLIDRAVDELEPAHVVRYCDEVAAAARRAQPTDAVRAATAVALRRSLGLLNIDLPASLDHLPPAFAAAAEPASTEA